MLIGGLYLLSFLCGVFTVWHFGKKAYYDEERLIDIALFSTVIGLLLSRISFLLSPAGRIELSLVTHSNDMLLSTLSILQVNSGTIWWIGVMAFYTTAIFLLYKWKWPLWPVLGFITWGSGIAIITSELFTWYWKGLTMNGTLLALGIFIVFTMRYLHLADGAETLRDVYKGIKHGIKERMSQRLKLTAHTPIDTKKDMPEHKDASTE
ncbi:hypothetical protein GW793_01940 [bacterium]|uniref:Uncharacterized protein n=2 Tax=Katanobacteria TaxID=422282 RepID=A0A2M7WZJ2_UNCKA|nr:hypothetical protein [bacterium]PIP56350.1 MAG: hypothetical protein COX05_03500 [candidate division WWE3 bacterium CG22_combo_CG10-13_8_21_14_all_39_12]PJA39007.1 MAG: hypothetical protein CO179_06060 [candidate division WWE3 bacterium CG_4_9_14_3_um_filter_39_7]